ncbi:MAG: FtsH protease activity modulator HflK [bacterium]
MPWTDKPGGSHNNGSGGNKGPWGQPPNNDNNGNNNQRPPDLEELLKSGRDKFRKSMGGDGGNGGGRGGGNIPRGPFALIAIGAVLFLLVQMSVYTVQAQQVAVVTTFGKFTAIEGPGLKFLIPFIQEREFVDIGADRSEAFGGNIAESAMLTKDLNIANVTFSVNWQVKTGKESPEDKYPGPAKFVLLVEEPETMLRSVAEAAVREVVGANDFDPLITNGRALVPTEMQRIMQEALDSYNSGIQILSVNYDKAQPPAEVIDDQLDVINARSQKQEKINTATAYANREVPKARGLAEKKMLNAEAYAAEKVAEAKGAAARFNDIYAEYRKAPEITRQRMYLETMESVLGDREKILLDDTGGTGPVPYLNINELNRRQATQ